MMSTMTLTDFLLARIAEDEAVADRAARHGSIGSPVPGSLGLFNGVGQYPAIRPDRLAAECEAKRRIVAEFQRNAHLVDTAPEVLATEVRRTNLTLEGVLLHHAAVYADHPDYQPEWRP